MNNTRPLTVSVWFSMLAALAGFIVGVTTGKAILAPGLVSLTLARDRAEKDAALLQDIADMREELFQQDERKLGAVSWCLTSSPTPIECVRYSLEATR